MVSLINPIMANLYLSIISSIAQPLLVNYTSKDILSKYKNWGAKMTAHSYRLREHGVPIWHSNQIWLYNNDDCKIMALNPLENSPGLLNCLSSKSKIGTDCGVSISFLIKHYRQVNVIYFLEHWLNLASKTVIRFGWMWGVGGLSESLGSFPYIYAQLAVELPSFSLSLTSWPRLWN